MLSLFKDLFIADGFNRSLLVDMTRGKYHLISKRWSRVISLLDNRVTGKEVETYLAKRKSSPLGQLYSFLTEHEMIFEVDKELAGCFTSVRMENETPSLLDSLFIFLSPQNIRSLSVLFKRNRDELDSVYIYRFFVEDRILLDHLETFETIIKSISLTSMIVIGLNKNLKDNLTNFSVGDEKSERIVFDEFDGPVEQDFYLQKAYLSRFPVFNIGMPQITGSVSANTYFGKSLFIDSEGYIKGSFNDDFTHGKRTVTTHIDDWVDNKVDLYALKDRESVNRVWSVSLSRVEICKDCEFRNICVDCRQPFLNAEYWNKDLCSYNPFISKWENESGYVPASDCGRYLPTGEFVKDLQYIDKLNQKLWH